MTVYVDAMHKWGAGTTAWPYPESCHMIADSEQELDAFAGKIGLLPRWKQSGRRGRRAHYDLTTGKRSLAIRYGAVEIDRHDFAQKMRQS